MNIQGALHVPPPVLLNLWKHHGLSIRVAVQQMVHDETVQTALPQQLRTIGASQMDVYLGSLLPAAIAGAINGALHECGVAAPAAYEQWIAAHDGYRTLDLPDGSRWVLRLGNTAERYVHIHPGRYSPHTIRVRAPVLQTAIAAIAWASKYGGDPLDVGIVNAARISLIGLQPLRSVHQDQGVGAVIAALAQLPVPAFDR